MRYFESNQEGSSFGRRVLMSFMPYVVGMLLAFGLVLWGIAFRSLHTASQAAYRDHLIMMRTLSAASLALPLPWEPELDSRQRTQSVARWTQLLSSFLGSTESDYVLLALVDPEERPVIYFGTYNVAELGTVRDQPILRFQNDLGVITLPLGEGTRPGYLVSAFRNPWAHRWLLFYGLTFGGAVLLSVYLLVATRFISRRVERALSPLSTFTQAVRALGSGKEEPVLPRPEPSWPWELTTLHEAFQELTWRLRLARLQTDQLLEVTTEHRNMLLTLANLLARTSVQTTEEEFWASLAPTLVNLVRADAVGLFTLDPSERLQPRLLFNLSPQVQERLEKERRLQQAGGGWARQVLERGTVLVVEDVLDENPLGGWAAWMSEEGLHAMVALPLQHYGYTVGLLTLLFGNTVRLSEEDLHLLQIVAGEVAAWLNTLHAVQAERRAQEHLAAQATQLTFMNELIAAINHTSDIQEIMTLAHKHLSNWLSGDHITLRVQSPYTPRALVLGTPISAEVEQALLRLLRNQERLHLTRNDSPPPVQAAMATLGAYHLYALAVEADGVNAWGVLWHCDPTPLAREVATALMTVSYALTGGLVRAVAHARVQEHLRREQRLSELIATVSETLDLDAVLNRVLIIAQEITAADGVIIGLVEEDTVTYAYTRGAPDRFTGHREPLKGSLVERSLLEGPHVLTDDELLKEMDPAFASLGVRATMVVPLVMRGIPLGVLAAFTRNPDVRFEPASLVALENIARSAAVAISNARLLTATQRHVEILQNVMARQQEIIGTLDLDQVLYGIGQSALHLIPDAEDLHIYLYDNLNDRFTLSTALWRDGRREPAVPYPRQGGLTYTVARTGRPIIVNDVATHPLYGPEYKRKWGLEAIAGLPLIHRDRVIGVFNIAFLKPHRFREEELRILTLLANQAAIAIVNAQAYKEMQELDRLKDELIQNLSHELRTPLTFVKGYTELLLTGDLGPLTPDQEEALRVVQERTEGIVKMVSDILDLSTSRMQDLELTTVNVGELVERAVQSGTVAAQQRGLSLQADLRDRPIIRADSHRLTQVLDNLIGNALKFTPPGRRVVVGVEEVQDGVHIWVQDEGIGIPPDQQEKIFDRFYQVDGSTRRRYGGAGVGLALVRRIVEAHGGRVWVESEVGQGSTFHVLFPKPRNRDSAPE